MKTLIAFSNLLVSVIAANGDITGPFQLYPNQWPGSLYQLVAYGSSNHLTSFRMDFLLLNVGSGSTCSNSWISYQTADFYLEEKSDSGTTEYGLFVYGGDGTTKFYGRGYTGPTCSGNYGHYLRSDATINSAFKTCNPLTTSSDFLYQNCNGYEVIHIAATQNVPTTSECVSTIIKNPGSYTIGNLKSNDPSPNAGCTVGQSSFSWSVVAPPSPPPVATSNQDPHLVFSNGARADFRGYDDGYFNFVSYPGMSVNVHTQKSTFNLRGVIVEGTFITEAFVNGITSDGKIVRLEHSSLRANNNNWGWNMVNGTCDGKAFHVFPHFTKVCGNNFKVKTDISSSDISFKNWRLRFKTNHVYNHIDGASKRLDLRISGPRTNMSHGILGQSFNKEIKVLHGKLDKYPKEGRFKTSAQAEGSIQGNHHMYSVSSPFDNNFPYSRFNDNMTIDVSDGMLESYTKDTE